MASDACDLDSIIAQIFPLPRHQALQVQGWGHIPLRSVICPSSMCAEGLAVSYASGSASLGCNVKNFSPSNWQTLYHSVRHPGIC